MSLRHGRFFGNDKMFHSEVSFIELFGYYILWNPFPMISLVFEIRINASGWFFLNKVTKLDCLRDGSGP